MANDRKVSLRAFTKSELIGELASPNFKPRVMCFECPDPQECRAMRLVSNLMGVNEGEFLPGGLSSLLYGTEPEKLRCYESIKRGHGSGVREVWLVVHTCCSADKKKLGELSSVEDIKIQEEKLLRGTRNILEFSEKWDLGLRVVPILIQIASLNGEEKGSIYKLGHSLVEHDDPILKQSVIMQTVAHSFAQAAVVA